ncbi:tyrosine-type recombinase/integrase [Bacillus ndiopicus]|uniref:tyrosine-type recombinase/integrase n=1 Tax=Bacillus ndiopicus TaxID=1347368 RepID=UPI0005A7B82B|nr:site-specific integrase [Bacillus ndiopicus]
MLLKFAFEDFIADRKFNNTTEGNINTYRYMVKPFIDFCIENGAINVEDVTRNHLKTYLMEYQQKGKGRKANSINTIILRVRAVWNYFIEEKIATDNITVKIKTQKVDVKIDTFTDLQVNQMLSFYRTQKKKHQSYSSYRNYVIILVFLGTGIRRKELALLKWNDIDFKNHTMSVYGKNRQYETVFMTEKLARELLAFRSFSSRFFERENENVFVTNTNDPLTNNTLEYVFTELKNKMNFSNVRVSPHTFRHTFCHRLVMSGTPVFAIQKLMRHAHIQTTMRYVNLWGSELKDENDKHNPLNNFDF